MCRIRIFCWNCLFWDWRRVEKDWKKDFFCCYLWHQNCVFLLPHVILCFSLEFCVLRLFDDSRAFQLNSKAVNANPKHRINDGRVSFCWNKNNIKSPFFTASYHWLWKPVFVIGRKAFRLLLLLSGEADGPGKKRKIQNYYYMKSKTQYEKFKFRINPEIYSTPTLSMLCQYPFYVNLIFTSARVLDKNSIMMFYSCENKHCEFICFDNQLVIDLRNSVSN